jgi:DNA-binding CsgD family transcriptional regulator
MTVRNVVLAVDTTTIPEVGRLLAQQDIQLGPVVEQAGRLRFFSAEYPQTPGITDDDMVLLALIAAGYTDYATARLYGDTQGRTKHALRRLYRKLHAQNREHAIAVAYRMGILNYREEAA